MVIFNKESKLSSFLVSFLKLIKANKKKTIIIVAIVLLIFTILILPKILKKSTPAITTTVAKVDRGNITQLIEGSGTIEAIDQYEITSLVSGDILEDYFNEGDVIEKGTLMYKIDTADIDNTIKRANLSIEKSRLSYDNAAQSVANLNVKSTVSGTITNVYIKSGDQVSNGSKIADVVNNQTMKLTIDFLSDFADKIYIGQSAQIELIGSFSTATGTLKYFCISSLSGVILNLILFEYTTTPLSESIVPGLPIPIALTSDLSILFSLRSFSASTAISLTISV